MPLTPLFDRAALKLGTQRGRMPSSCAAFGRRWKTLSISAPHDDVHVADRGAGDPVEICCLDNNIRIPRRAR
jgi:hypothetical protein